MASGPLSFTLMPGQNAIFTQTDSLMFDGSEASLCRPLCPPGAFVLFFTVTGTSVRVPDTSGVLTTFGFDQGNSDACGFAGCNESVPCAGADR